MWSTRRRRRSEGRCGKKRGRLFLSLFGGEIPLLAHIYGIYPICRPFSPHGWWPLLPPFAAPEAALSKIERKIVPTQPREREREASFVRAMNFSSSLSSVP